MKILRIGVSLLFVIVTLMFGWVYFNERFIKDKTIPYIKISESMIEVSIKASEQDLLKGVTAYDEKDKDLTDKVIVESISKFIDTGVCKVTYAVCDSDNHVAKASRKIRYVDYVSPRFKMSRSICYSIHEKINLLEVITAQDCIDGNVSRNIILTSENYTGLVAGVYSITASVTNSNGDISTLTLPLILEDREVGAPDIVLKDYLLYVKPGSRINFSDLIVSAIGRNDVDYKNNVIVEANVDLDQKGVHTVHYYASDDKGLRGHAVLTVVVE